MPLDKRCDKAAVGRNISTLVREGKSQKQAVAIAMSVHERVCGKNEERAGRCGSVAVSDPRLPSRKKLRKKKPVDEASARFAEAPKVMSPNRVPRVSGDGAPIHRKYKKNIRSKPFIDPEDFGLKYIPVESLFREAGFQLTSTPQGPGHGVGTSPSASTTKKPTDRKRKKVRVAPTRKS